MNFLFTGIVLEIIQEQGLSTEFKEFLSLDDQGMEGLEFMLKDPKLCRRIPTQVRAEYEILYGNMAQNLQDRIEEIRKMLDQLEENPKPVIHQAIQKMYEAEK